MDNILQKRIDKLRKILKEHNPKNSAALLLSANPILNSTRDNEVSPYLPNYNLFYLSNSESNKLHLLIKNNEKKILLFAEPTSEKEIIWDGKKQSLKKLAQQLSLEYRETHKENLHKDIIEKLKNIEILYTDNNPQKVDFQIKEKLQNLLSYSNYLYPHTFKHNDEVFSELRLYKTTDEIKKIKEAISITAEAMSSVQTNLKVNNYEYMIQAELEYHYRLNNAYPSFPTICANGKNAATLHYTRNDSKLKNNTYILIDTGTRHKHYCSDITRCFPIGKPKEVLNEIYEIVTEAKYAAIKKAKDNVKIKSVYLAAAKVLTEGLKELGVLKGKTSTLMNKKAYLPYFMHGIGHSLGLNVHDIGKHRANNKTILKKGMVFTIEPGLYFQKKTGSIPACGFRNEDDILIEKNTAKNLSIDIKDYL